MSERVTAVMKNAGAEPKPGYLTTEFYLAMLASIVSFIYASGVLETTPTQWDDRAVALVAGVLASLGYTVSRTMVKRS